ncbi:related to 4-coumarate-CoA ligase [Phialocephala subalpina]|uniref:Related to 4-coumarate-CoA ligase n=1 Tax=Phialocephala subalpina TaxID=576137 RepID=A0A1L7WUT9_9HELO|nr:related to 4-coumarate-CoA ligase [Phialocephala subalpina]
MPAKIYHSPYPDVVPFQGDLTSFIFSNPNNTPGNKPSYIDVDTNAFRTYNEVEQRTLSLAYGLRELGIKEKDNVAFISPNSIDYAITCFAIIGCGATVVPASASLTVKELTTQLETSGARYLIAHSSLLAVVEKAVKSIPYLQVIQADGEHDKLGKSTAEYLASTCPASELVTIKPEEADSHLSFMCFSSGTTGRAKGVMLTHKNIIVNVQQWTRQIGGEWDRESTTIGFQPFNHIYGVHMFSCIHLFNGATVVVMPRFEFGAYLGAIQRYKPETLFSVPPVILLLKKDPRVTQYDLSSVKRIMSAAAPLSNELRKAVEKRFEDAFGTTIFAFQAWGLTETSPLASMVPPGRRDKAHTVGCISPNMEFRVVDPETHQDVEVDEDGCTLPGEIWCRGPNVTPGYFKNDIATRNSFTRDNNGAPWFMTGDIGTIDKDGYITIVDRIKEMIKYKGLQVIPSELEGILLGHQDIVDASVVGIWVEDLATELPVGFIVISQSSKTKGNNTVVQEIHEWFSAKVANHKKLRGGIYIVDAIPKSPSGKILRRKLKDSLTVMGGKIISKL